MSPSIIYLSPLPSGVLDTDAVCYPCLMPELPEVESLARTLRRAVSGRVIRDAEILWPRTLHTPARREFLATVRGARITDTGRRAKYLLIHLDSGHTLVVHLRMSGDLFLLSADTPRDPHVRASLQLDNNIRVDFHDPRKFGRLYLVRDAAKITSSLGIEPLSEGFTVEHLASKLASTSRMIKPLLLDQRIVAGLGNIYTVEALWEAGIHPCRKACSLKPPAVEKLHGAIRSILAHAVEAGGTDLGDGVWKSGSFSPRVYAHEGEPCPRCGTILKRLVVAQRGTTICSKCQRAR